MINSLEKGVTYYVRVTSFNGVTDLSYKLTLKSHGELAADASEPNNSFEAARSIKAYNEAYGTFSSSQDKDYYYYKNTSNTTILQGFEFLSFPLKEDASGKIPKLLTEDLPIFINVYEDTNGNKKLEDSEREKAMLYENYGDITKGSFQTKPNHGYFFEVTNAFTEIPNIHEYGLRFYSMNRTDEDAKAKYTNGLPSIVLPLRTAAPNTYVGRGYLNANVANGDADFFKISVNTTRTIYFSLDMPMVGMNGKVSFYYSNGKRVASFDRYTFSDGEVGEITLKKGNYYIKVEEVNGISDFDKYQLTIRNN